jgi:hypothetical protein
MSEPIPDWHVNIQKFYEKQGFLVFASLVPLPCGYIVRTAHMPGVGGNNNRVLPQPFSIIASASREEYLAQSKLLGWCEPDVPSYAHYYRAVTD